MDDDTKKMSAERIASMAQRVAPCVDGTATAWPIFAWREVAGLLAHIEALEAERDEARREVCLMHGWMRNRHTETPVEQLARNEAQARGWGYLHPERIGS